MITQREEAPNTELAQLLDKAPSIDSAIGEKKVRNNDSTIGYIDVAVTARNARIAVEAKLAKRSPKLTQKHKHKLLKAAAQQAISRVKNGHAHHGVALLYPPGTTTRNLRHQPLEWCLANIADPVGTINVGAVTDLAEWLADLSDTPEAAAAQLLAALHTASDRLTKNQRKQMADYFGIRVDTSKNNADNLICKASVRVLLIIAAATMFHCRLQKHLNKLPAPTDPQRRAWPPGAPMRCAHQNNPAAAFREAWDQILLVDYKPIFESAIGVLDSMSHTGHNFTEAVRGVTKTAVSISGTAAAQRHDLLGRVFHKVLDSARYDGSFYTSTSAATLLAGLALRDDTADWSNPCAVTRLRVCDPACGSGTLLMASAERITNLRLTHEKRNDPDTDHRVGSHLLEKVLWGYDINLAACHLTATTLGLLAPSVEFSQMNIFRTRLGVERSKNNAVLDVNLGSLDLLAADGSTTSTADTQLVLQPMTPGEQQQIDDTEQHRAQSPPKMDLVVMNPPFTRDSLRHDQYSRADEQEIKKREKELIKKHPNRAAARLHSSGGMFLLLAEHLTKADQDSDGSVALVLPAVAATSSGNLAFREFIAESFHVEHVVVPHDPRRIAFSENTNISEILLVARRSAYPPPNRGPTRFVKLLHNPDNPADANLMAGRIASASPGEQPSLFNPFIVQEVPAVRMVEGDWQATGFMSTWLYDQWKKLVDGCSRLGDIAKVEPAGQAIRGAYRKSKIATGRQAFWNHKSSRVKTLALKPDTWISAKPPEKKPAAASAEKKSDVSSSNQKQSKPPPKKKPPTKKKPPLADQYWAMRSRLLIANRINLPTMRLFAVWSENPAVGSAFCPVTPTFSDGSLNKETSADITKTETLREQRLAETEKALAETEKALAVWFNSTLGILGVYGSRALKKLPYPSFSLGILRDLPVPELDAISRSKLAAVFNEHQHDEVLPFPHVGTPPGATITQCPTRKAFDVAVCEALGGYLGVVFGKQGRLGPAYVQSIADALAAEPCLTDRRTNLS